MNPRLEALLRQRELLRVHTEWLDAEIASERTRLSPPPETVAPLARAASPSPETLDPTVNLEPEADIRGIHDEVRQGCMIYVILATLLVAGVIGFIYWKY